MITPKFFLSIVLSILFFTSCQQTPPPTEVKAAPDIALIRAELQGMEDAFSAALKAKDAKAVVAYYADDAISLQNNGPILKGKAAILANQEKEFANSSDDDINVKFEIMDIMTEGDLVIETGKSTTTDSEGKIIQTGKWMSIFVKRNGKYVCIRDIYNDDKVAPIADAKLMDE